MIQMRRSEYQILRDLDHPNIVRALDFFCSARTAVLVLSYHPGGTLSQAIRASGCPHFSEEVARHLCRMLFAAVDYLHQHRIVHRDVKADNILVSEDLSDLHLADFNTARSLLDGGSLTMTGTVEYSAPEVLAGESPSELHDIWGAGLCLHMMLTGALPRRSAKYPTLAAFHDAVTAKPVDCQGAEWSEVSQDAKDTVRRCLAVSKEERPAAMTVLK
ncbi:CPK3, partial [Symbiodinium sp. KB8]